MADQHALTLIQEERFLEFNNYVEAHTGPVDLSNAHLRAYDLRKCNLKTADLRGAYMRSCDLRSCDLSQAQLDGASMKEAKVSGVMFPRNISASEIDMSLVHGTRIRSNL